MTKLNAGEIPMNRLARILTCALAVAVTSSATAADDQNKLTTDEQFVQQAITLSFAEIKLSEVAAKNAGSEKVTAFANKMVKEHKELNQRLVERARDLKIAVLAGLEKKNKAEIERLAELKGAEFDREYMKDIVQGHEKLLKLFVAEGKSGVNVDLKTFARETTPAIRDHLKEARAILAEVKK
jgi:putative membrane protein